MTPYFRVVAALLLVMGVMCLVVQAVDHLVHR